MKPTLEQKIKSVFWTIFIVVAGVFFVSVFLRDNEHKKIMEPYGNTATVIGSLASEEAIPQYSYFVKDPNQKVKISAAAYLVGDLGTGEIILAKNQDKQFPLASVSKLMTASIAEELTGSEDTTKISKKALATYGRNGNLKAGEKIKLTDLIYPLLLESSNDAAEAIAEYFGRDIFIKRMNQEAIKLELSKTTFEDPSGLSPKNQSTVLDMFKFAGYLNQKQPDLFKITTKRSYSDKKHNWSSTNQFLLEDGYLGGKSGFTDPALQTVVSLFSVPLSETGDRHIAITLLQSKDRFKDVENILRYLSKNIYYGGEADANTAWVKERTDVPLVYDQDFVTLTFGGDIMLDRGVKNSVNKNFGGDYSTLFEKLGMLKKSDIVFANLEGPVSDAGKDMRNLYSFRMDPSVIPAIKGAGFDILSVANNHMGDWGREAFENRLEGN